MLAAASTTSARELQLSVDGRVGGDSNILRRTADEIEDGFFEVSPKVRLLEASEELNYDVYYRPTYQTFVDTSGIDGFDHRAGADLTWSLDAKSTIGLASSYLNARQLRFDSEVVGGPNIFEVSDRERLQRSSVDLYYQLQLSPRYLTRLTLSFDDFDYRRNLNFDSRGYTAQLYGQYALSPRLSVGLSSTARRRITAPVTGSDGSPGDVLTRSLRRVASTADVYSVGAFFNAQLTPSIAVSMQAGPTFIVSRQRPDDVQQALGIGFDRETDLTVFASASASKEWERADLEASYVRSESRGAGNSSSSISDLVNVRYGQELSRSWYLRLDGTWDQREQILEVAGGGRLKTTLYRAVGSASYRVSRRVQLIMQYSYLHQEQDAFVGSAIDVQAHIGFLSLRYTFDPIRF